MSAQEAPRPPDSVVCRGAPWLETHTLLHTLRKICKLHIHNMIYKVFLLSPRKIGPRFSYKHQEIRG